MARKCWFLIGVLFLALCYPKGIAYGQAVYGSIVGTITDPSAAAVPNAKVTIIDIGKNVSFSTTTNMAGNYEQTNLIAGVYRVRIEVAGFQTYVQENVQVNVDAAARVDAVLKVGAVAQEVEVTAALPLLQTERTDVATTFSERQVEDLPVYNRNFTTFQLLSPGSARLNGWNHAASENPQGSGQIMTQGQHFAGTAFELDGTDNQDPILGIIIINPNLEAVTETKITAQDYDAQFGKAMGDVVATQTKSGSNLLHGSAFDFERANADFARNPFTQATIGVPSGNWQQFGGALGGPIRKNKVFIFGDYQGTRSDVGGSVGDRIPTATERTGDLSDLGIPIYDPYETTDSTHQTLVLNAQGQPIPLAFADRTQFPGNVIPTSRLSPQTQNLLAMLPVGASGTGLSPNYFGSGVNLLNSNGFDVRSDAYATEKLHIFGRYSFQQFARAGPGLFGVEVGGPAIPSDPSVGTFSGISGVRNQSLASGGDYTLSPAWLTDFRFGWHRYRVNVLPGGYGTTPATAAGIPGLNLDTTYTSGMPYFAINTPGAQLFSFGYALGNSSETQCNCPLTEREYQFQFVNNWTNIRGSHTIKFGADIRYNHNLRVPSDTHRAGQLTFNNDITEGPGGVGGAGLAGFMLGDVSTFGRYISTSTNAYETQPRLFFYGEDSWRVTHKLTFNFGLRWEIYEPESVAGTGEGGWVDLATGEMRVAGEQGVDMRGNTTTSFTHLAPRIGLAYQADSKTVIRVGYGRSYDMGVFGTIFGHTVTQNLPVLAAQSISPGPGNTAFFLSQGPPAAAAVSTILTQNNCNAITDPTGATLGTGGTTVAGFPGSDPNNPNSFVADKTECVGPNGRALIPDGWNSRARPFNNRLPTVDAYNATVQRQLTPTIAASIAYVGNKGTHNMYDDDDNYEVNQSGPVVGYNPNTPAIYGPVLPSDCTNPSMLPHLCREPYYLKYGWTQSMAYFGNDANSLYSALVVNAQKRFAGGLSFQSSYTYQRSSDNETSYFNINHNVYHGPSNDYRDSVWIFTEVYELPFGKGKKFLGSPSRVLDAAIGGWKLNSATNFSSGLPFTPGLSTCGPTIDFGPCMPDKVGAVANGPRSGPPGAAGYWFQISPVPLTTAGETGGPWAQPALDTFGNVGRNSLRGPKWFNTDLAMFKDFTVTEKVKAEMQFQFYNIFNHVNLGLPNGCVDCSNGGSITGINWGAQMRAITFGLKFSF